MNADWVSFEKQLRVEYREEREALIAAVREAMAASGQLECEVLAEEWYGNWIAKRADELFYLQLTTEERRAAVKVTDFELFEEKLQRGAVLILGTHFGSHTLAPTHLDTLGIPQTLIVHSAMRSLVGSYGLRSATFASSREEVVRSLLHAQRHSGVVVTYADVDDVGSPRLAPREEDVERLIRMKNALGGSVMRFEVEAKRGGGRCEWQIRLIPYEARLSGLSRDMTKWMSLAPSHWMLWRRLTKPQTDEARAQFGKGQG